MLRITIALIFVFVFSFGAMVQAQDVPAPVGFVNDFANMLKPEQRQELETILQGYKDKTAIEFAVVTEDSLKGKDKFDRSLEIARSWGIGDKQTGHGLLLYIALKDRAYFMQISRHLEGDLPDGLAGQIQRENLVPNFRNEQYFKGIKLTVEAVINRLGETTMVERERLLAERAKIEQQQREQDERDAAERWRKFKAAMPYIFPPLGILILLLVIVLLVRKRRARQAALQTQFSRARKQIEAEFPKLRLTDVHHAKIEKQLTLILTLAPHHDWSKLKETVSQRPQIALGLEIRIKKLKDLPTESILQLEVAVKTAHVILVDIRTAAKLLSGINGEIANIQTAMTTSRSLIGTLPTRIAAIQDKLTLPNVPEKAREKVKDAQAKFKEAKHASTTKPIDWPDVRTLFVRVEESLASADALIQESQRPKQVTRSSRSSKRSSGSFTTGSSRKNDDTGFYFSPVATTTIASGGGGGFGGFGGGGDFGGGGAGGGW